MIFMHFRNIQEIFQDYSEFSFTIVGSEMNVSRNLSNAYFPEDSYLEVPQGEIAANSKHNLNKVAFYITKKIQRGMHHSFHNKDTDIIIWAGSNDYISFSFWRQMIEEYHPKRHMLFGMEPFHRGRNVVFYTKFNGDSLINRTTAPTYWQSGHQHSIRAKLQYIGGVLGVTRSVLRAYPATLQSWNCDEGHVEESILSAGKGRVKLFHAKEAFFMNIKEDAGHEVTNWKLLHDLNFRYRVLEANLSAAFLCQFDSEFRLFDGFLRV